MIPFEIDSILLNPSVTSGTYISHLQSFQVRWDNSIPLLLHAAIYLEVSLFRWTSQNAFPRVQMILCAMLLCSIAHSIICTRLFCGKMHSDWFNGMETLQGRWQHGEKAGYCYPRGLEKTLCKWDIYVPLVTKGLSHRAISDAPHKWYPKRKKFPRTKHKPYPAWFQIPAAKYMSPALFRVITQRVMITAEKSTVLKNSNLFEA